MILPGLYCRIPMRRRVFTSVVMALVLGLLPVRAQDSSNPRETLKQYVADLQRNPDDRALREKIIKLALDMRPTPATPPEALELEGAAEYAFKNAKGVEDFADAARQYEKALLLAPWKAADYFNLGVAQERAQQSKPAIQSFELYLLAAPNANDNEEVRKRIGGLRFAAGRAEQQEDMGRARQAAAERERRDKEVRRRSVEGVWHPGDNDCAKVGDADFSISRDMGGQLVVKMLYHPDVNSISAQTVVGNHVQFTNLQNAARYGTTFTFKYDLTLSADGMMLVGRVEYYLKGKYQSNKINPQDKIVECRQE